MESSVFEGTLVNMSYPQIEKMSQENAPVLIPISVIEEHGPHLCTGVDLYLTQCVCSKIQEKLHQENLDAIIAPPFYWGVNSITNGFMGSFNISQETTKRLLYEIIQNFETWGFKNVFLVSFHGDFKHMKTIADITLEIQENLTIKTYYLAEQGLFHQLKYNDLPICFVPVQLEASKINVEPDFLDIHAGANETSWMALEFPTMVDFNVAKKLKPTQMEPKDMKKWSLGGNAAKELTPLGYCGNPANIQLEKINRVEIEVVNKYADCIKNVLGL